MSRSDELNTITDKDWRSLQTRARKVEPPPLNPKTIERRLANNEQLRKRKSS